MVNLCTKQWKMVDDGQSHLIGIDSITIGFTVRLRDPPKPRNVSILRLLLHRPFWLWVLFGNPFGPVFFFALFFTIILLLLCGSLPKSYISTHTQPKRNPNPRHGLRSTWGDEGFGVSKWVKEGSLLFGFLLSELRIILFTCLLEGRLTRTGPAVELGR